MFKRLLILPALLILSGCSVLAPLPDKQTTSERLNSFPLDFDQLERPVEIRWNDFMVPYILAETDQDAAFTLGLTHAHLRLGQMEVLKRISQARISEMAGPFTQDIDEALRILQFGRAAQDIVDAMPPETRKWMDAYVDGVNAYKDRLSDDELPHDYKIFGLSREPWKAADSLAMGRLFGTDVNWLVWFSLLPESDKPNFDEIYAQAVNSGVSSTASFSTTSPETPGAEARKRLTQILAGFSKSGSNSVVVSAEKSANGHSMIASDPHLGFNIPNAWIMAGIKSPSFDVVGMMPPGIPAIGFGRTPDIAWGGTNLRSMSSDLVDVSDLDPRTFIEETETLKTRFWFDKTITRRVSPYGPIISDAELFPNPEGKTLALRWAGHQISDEITALLNMARSKDGQDFLAAAVDFSLPGQNFLYADQSGRIGHVIAAHMPNHKKLRRVALTSNPKQSDQNWQSILKANDLPYVIDRETGFIASANNKPTQPDDYDIGVFFPPDERIRRLQQMLEEKDKITLTDLKYMQRDVVSPSALELINLFRDLDLTDWSSAEKAQLQKLLNWNGSFDANKSEPVLLVALINAMKVDVFEALKLPQSMGEGRNERRLIPIFAELLQGRINEINSILKVSLIEASEIAKDQVWGDIHRLKLQYIPGFAPLIGGSYQIGNYPISGSIETVMKTAHDLTTDVHRTQFGAQSRHISNMGDIDENYFILVGGNDGWFNAQNVNDQTELWLNGEYIQIPLRLSEVKKQFQRQMIVNP